MHIGRKMARRRREAEEEEYDDGTWRDWAGGVPEGVLGNILDRLSVSDCVTFLDVCTSWSNVIKSQLQFHSQSRSLPPRGFPLLLGSGQRFRCSRTCLSLLDNFSSSWMIDMPDAYMKYCWGSFHDWLILVEHCQNAFSSFIDIKLFNPFSRVTIELPSAINLFKKMILSGRPTEEDFVCILLYKENCYAKFWVPGLQRWNLCCRLSYTLVDGVFCNGSFYLLTGDLNIVKIDLRDVLQAVVARDCDRCCDSSIRTQVLEIKMSSRPRTNGVLRYLVESEGEVLLVCRFFNTVSGVTIETTKFLIYILDVFQMAWRQLENLGDRILFLGRCCSRSFSALDLGIQKANYIYFTNDCRAGLSNEWDFPKFQQKLSHSVFEGLEENSDWGIVRFNDEDLRHFTFHGNLENAAPIWITAPLSSLCREGEGV